MTARVAFAAACALALIACEPTDLELLPGVTHSGGNDAGGGLAA